MKNKGIVNSFSRRNEYVRKTYLEAYADWPNTPCKLDGVFNLYNLDTLLREKSAISAE